MANRHWISSNLSAILLVVLALPAIQPAPSSERIISFNNDGAWSWFQDERAIIAKGWLIIGSVASGVHDKSRKGDIEVLAYNLNSGQSFRTEVHDQLLSARGEYDDHNAPALWMRPDGRVLAVYAMHGQENRFYSRISNTSLNLTRWRPGTSFTPSESSRITYANLYYLRKENGGRGRVYNFFRGLHNSFKPSYAYSDDHGETWTAGQVFIDVPEQFRHRPYVKYASNGVDTVHFFYTDGHPRNFDNSTYHAFYRNGYLHRSDGTVIRPLADGLKSPSEGNRIFQGDAGNVAWVSDIHVDANENPYVAYSVQKNSAGLPPGQGGEDHRYRNARWTGNRWVDYELAYAGSRLYPGEDDYTGNVTLDRDDAGTVYISTNADPATGQPLVSRSDRMRHYEIFKGVTSDGGRTWAWTAVTSNSTSDNIRPMAPKSDGRYNVLLWLRGQYTSYTNYKLEIVGIVTIRVAGKNRNGEKTD